MTQEELNIVLEKHKKWLNDEAGGECADLRDTNLSSVDLSHANLRYADLSYAALSNVNLRNADLFHINLRGADLRNLAGAEKCFAGRNPTGDEACRLPNND